MKPVLFASLDVEVTPRPTTTVIDWPPRVLADVVSLRAPLDSAPDVHAIQGVRDMALIIDLPGAMGARAGIAFAGQGLRPIPLYNAVPGELALVDLRPIMTALVDGAETVARVPVDAPPMFLLDSDRMGPRRAPVAGIFDNRSVCRESDFPSAELLLRSGIRHALLLQNGNLVAPDLEPILLAWRTAGIELWIKIVDNDSRVAPLQLARRGLLARAIHFVRRMWLHRRADGAYGKFVPHTSLG